MAGAVCGNIVDAFPIWNSNQKNFNSKEKSRGKYLSVGVGRTESLGPQ